MSTSAESRTSCCLCDRYVILWLFLPSDRVRHELERRSLMLIRRCLKYPKNMDNEKHPRYDVFILSTWISKTIGVLLLFRPFQNSVIKVQHPARAREHGYDDQQRKTTIRYVEAFDTLSTTIDV